MGVKRKILVTGSNGLLGQKLVQFLKDHNSFDLIATSRGESRISDREGYTYASMDISLKEEVEKVLSTYKPNIIIHTAAMTNVDACEEDKENCWLLNVTAVDYLLTEAKKYNTHFIHLSTDFIFDGKEGPYKEDALPNPLSYYGNSKNAAEELVMQSDVKWSIARTVLVYGLVEDMSRSNIVLWAKSALERKQKLTIVNDQFRTPTLAEDLALGCILIAEKEAEGIFHISGKDFMSIIDLVKRVAKFYKLDDSFIEEISSESLNQAAKRPPRTGFVLDKANEELGYQPRSFEEGILFLEEQLNQ